MIVVAHNLLAANANRQLGITTEEQKKSSEKLSSGYRINRAADDAAGLSISEKLRYQVRGLERGQKNTMDGVSWCQVGDGALQEVQEMVQRIRELAVQASNDTNTPEDRAAINEEVKALRREINQTSYNAMFNSQHIFESKEASFGVVGVPNDLGVYTANTNIHEALPLTGGGSTVVDTDNYGGLIFDGNRIPWGEVHAYNDMIDTSSTPDTFKSGKYNWQDTLSGRFFNIRVDDSGTDLPKYTREMTIKADITHGVNVDGEWIPWNKVVDEEGIAMSDATKHDGVWTFNYHGADVGFYLTGIEDMDDVVREISDPHMDRMSYSWEVPYTGAAPEQAVDATNNQYINVTNKIQKTLHDNRSEGSNEAYYVVRVDQTGVWLEDVKTNAMVADSKKSWQQLFVPDVSSGMMTGKTWEDWVKGGQLSKNFTYTYTDLDNDQWDTQVSFTFDLSDITGLDDVMEGLNGMLIHGTTTTSYQATDINPADHVKVYNSNIYISYEDEKTLGRDFDKQADKVATGSYSFDDTSKKLQLTLENGSNQIVMDAKIQGIDTLANLENEMLSGVSSYMDYILEKKKEQTLQGLDAQALAQTSKLRGHNTGVTATFESRDTDGKYHPDVVDSHITNSIIYSHNELIDQIEVKLKQDDASGLYVLADDNKSYREYNPATDVGRDRFILEVSYKKDGVTYAGKDELFKEHKKTVMLATFGRDTAGKSNSPTDASRLAKINLNTTDYTKVSYHGQEKPNSANRSQFKSVVVKTPQRYGIHIQNSSNVGDNLLIEKFAMNTVELGLFAIHTRDYEGAQKTIGACDNAMAVLNDRRSYFGASQNRLEHTYANSANAEENQQAAESRIRDTDMAEEMVKYSKNNILAQAGQSMLAQANQGTQGILNLLQ